LKTYYPFFYVLLRLHNFQRNDQPLLHWSCTRCNYSNSKAQFLILPWQSLHEATWYAIEYIEEQNVCYGYVTGMAYDEFGYFSIHELESLRLPLGLKIERDLYFDEIPFNDLKA